MKKLFRLHFAAIAVSDLLLLAIFISKTDLSVDWLVLFSSLLKDYCYFAWSTDSKNISLRFILRWTKKFASTI